MGTISKSCGPNLEHFLILGCRVLALTAFIAKNNNNSHNTSQYPATLCSCYQSCIILLHYTNQVTPLANWYITVMHGYKQRSSSLVCSCRHFLCPLLSTQYNELLCTIILSCRPTHQLSFLNRLESYINSLWNSVQLVFTKLMSVLHSYGLT